MPIYQYTALKNNKELITGKIEAESEKEARALLRTMELLPTKISEATTGKAEKKIPIRPLSLKEKIDLINTLGTLIKTGVPIIEALLFIENNADSVKTQNIVKVLRKDIMAGATFAVAINNYPQVFDYTTIGLIKAGEESGELDVTLERMSELLAKQDAIRGKVIGALIYPCMVLVLAFGVILLMLLFVFPTFADMYKQMNAELPAITTACINTGTFLKTYWYTIPLFIMAQVGIFMTLAKWEPAKRRVDEFSLKIPILKDLLKFAGLSNFISVMQVAYEAGVPVVNCMFLANLTVSNFTLFDAIKGAAQKVQKGIHISTALKATNIMPKMILFMISTGEQAGKLGDMLKQTSEFIDKELDRTVDAMTKMIEPIMLIVLGGIVMVMALALYLPLFQSYKHM